MIVSARLSIIRGGYFHCTPYWDRTKAGGGYIVDSTFSIYLPASGSAVVEAVSGECVLKPKHIYFIPNFSRHLVGQSCKKEMWVWWVQFVSESFYLHHRLAAIDSVLEFPLASVPIAEDVFRRFESFFEAPRPIENRDPRAEDSRVREDTSVSLGVLIEGTLMYLVSKVLDATEGEFNRNDHSGIERLRPAIEYMDKHYLRNPSLHEIADCIKLAPNYFHRAFKQHAGTTPFKYMENRRLDLAHKLLFDQRMNITEISRESGYQSLEHFIRTFRRRFGISPSRMRHGP